MNKQELESLTVIELRKIAKESHIKLGSGIDKAGIIEKLSALQKDMEQKMLINEDDLPAIHEPEDVIHDDSLSTDSSETDEEENPQEDHDFDALGASFDVTAAAPEYRQWISQQSAGYRPVHSSSNTGWQNRSALHDQQNVHPRSNWQQRAIPHRFGPQQRTGSLQGSSVKNQQTFSSAQENTDNTIPTVTSDGYRLGYRAAPQRNGYQPKERNNDYERNGMSRSYPTKNSYGNAASSAADTRNNYRVTGEGLTKDTLYRMNRSSEFAEQRSQGILPSLLQKAETVDVCGILEIMPDGYGFLRSKTLQPAKTDIYMAPAINQRYSLKTGDLIEGQARKQRACDKYSAMLTIDKINGKTAEEIAERPSFDQLVATYPDKRIVLECNNDCNRLSARIIDLFAPIGFGQRAMIETPPDCDSLKLLTEISCAVRQNDPEALVMILLIDTAPEDITEVRDGTDAEVYYTSFTDSPEVQTRLSETILECAERQVENGRNVVLLLDNLTKLTKAYQANLNQNGRMFSGTISPAALVKPKRLFGSARNIRDGGSLTVIAAIQINSDSKNNEMIYDEFSGTANMNLVLCRNDPDDIISPMIDLLQSGTKKDDLLLDEFHKEALSKLKNILEKKDNRKTCMQLIDIVSRTKSNEDFLKHLDDWLELLENG